MARSRILPCLLLVLLQLCSVPFAHAVKSSKSLPQAYKHWFEVEVPYIINKVEREEFLSLTTDAERDSFIDSFWRIRNPDPNSGINLYKEEHYRRLAYANENFGDAQYEDGWRTDRGRMYIILGAPKQRTQYHDVGNVRPLEIWFYQADTPALPPFFYLLFYKRSASEDFQLYSPKYDGPVRLCSTGETRNDPVQALTIIKKGLGADVANKAVSLLPNEHVSLDTFEPSMESDSLLAKLNDLPDNPFTKERLQANKIREKVKSSIFLGDNDALMSYQTARDDHGRLTLSYLLAMRLTDARLIGTRKDGSNYYDLTLRTDVLTTDGKTAYTQEDQLTGNLTPAQAEVARKKRFGAEARLPIAPGNYNVVATLTNNIDKVAIRQHALVTVPAVASSALTLSGLLAYTKPAALPDPRNQLPFSSSHLRFTPHGAQNVYLRQGDKLPLLFQLWLEPAPPGHAPPDKIHLHYVFGSITASHDEANQENEEIDGANRDQAGNLLTGHTLDTSLLTPGSYKVVVSATREGEKKSAYATLNLHVVTASDYIDTWTAYGPIDPAGDAVDDLKRGLSAEAQGQDDEAQAAYKRALAEGATDPRPIDNLAALLERKHQNDQLAALSQQRILEKTAVKPSTLVAIAGALNQSGNPKAAARMIETQILIQPPNAELYKILADSSQASGNTTRANEVRALLANLNK